jgi:uncharacterized membrane protein
MCGNLHLCEKGWAGKHGERPADCFSDGVIAIIITIMVLELKVPHGADWSALGSLVPVFLSYVLSFVYVAIYWNNHHHLLHTVTRVNGLILWANMHLLFWLSLTPFATAGWARMISLRCRLQSMAWRC